MAAVEPPRLLRTGDDCDSFDCGRESLNIWLRRRAQSNQAGNLSRTSVLCDAQSGAIVAFCALSAAQLERAVLPRRDQRNKPDPLPALLLGQLAVAVSRQGEGHARALLLFAFGVAVRAARQIGIFGLITHPLDDAIRAFYRRHGFVDLPQDPRGTMIVRTQDLTASGVPGAPD